MPQPAARSAWFAFALNYLDAFCTDRGTWCFPRDYLVEKGKSGGCYVLGYHMGLGESRRNKIALELESTYYMLSILQRAGDSSSR